MAGDGRPPSPLRRDDSWQDGDDYEIGSDDFNSRHAMPHVPCTLSHKPRNRSIAAARTVMASVMDCGSGDDAPAPATLRRSWSNTPPPLEPRSEAPYLSVIVLRAIPE